MNKALLRFMLARHTMHVGHNLLCNFACVLRYMENIPCMGSARQVWSFMIAYYRLMALWHVCSIPQEWQSLQQLRSLYLNVNQLTGMWV